MPVHYFRCDLCHAEVANANVANQGKFPVTRRFEDNDSETGLIAVRCAECADLPYRLEEGQPYRVRSIGEGDVTINYTVPTEYNFFPHGIGHVLEIYATNPSEEYIDTVHNGQFELGFFVYEDSNLIVVADRFNGAGWNLTPYTSFALPECLRALPSEDPSEQERTFTVALVDDRGGTYRAIRRGTLTPEFARAFHKAIWEQLTRGIPDEQIYRTRLDSLGPLRADARLDAMIVARCNI
jgi:hypothetical protein